jgi:hypothetical protein
MHDALGNAPARVKAVKKTVHNRSAFIPQTQTGRSRYAPANSLLRFSWLVQGLLPPKPLFHTNEPFPKREPSVRC